MDQECIHCKEYFREDYMIESGELANISLPLADDPCSTYTNDGADSSKCCHYDTEANQCVITFIGWKTFPCQLCDPDNSTSTHVNSTNTNTNTNTTNSTTTEPVEEITCACLDYYPNATMSTPAWEYGNSSSLSDITNHECRDRDPYYYDDGTGGIVNFAQCCEYDHESNQCGIMRDGNFTSPCGSCTIKSKKGTRTLSREIIMALVGGTLLILLLIACWFWKNRARPQNVRELARKANEQLNNHHTTSNNYHNGSQSQGQNENWTSLPIRVGGGEGGEGGVFEDNNDGEIVATAVGAPVIFAEVVEDGVNTTANATATATANAAPAPISIPVAVPNN